MENWTAVVTNAGKELLNRWAAGGVLTITKAMGCVGAVPAASMLAQTGLDGKSQYADVVSVELTNSNVLVTLHFPADIDGYVLRRIGIWAKVDDEEPVMMCLYQHNTTGVSIHALSETPNFLYVFHGYIAHNNTGICELDIDPLPQQEARDAAARSATSAGASAASAASDRRAGEEARDITLSAKGVTLAAKDDVETMQAALHLRRRVVFGSATDVDRLLPGDTLIITDGSSLEHTTDYYDLLQEAKKAAAGQPNSLEELAVLSVVNTTNLRRDADGLLWTTDTMGEFCTKLTAFAAAAVAGGYVDDESHCVATWAQAQAWIIEGVLLTPLDAETMDYYWRKVQPKSDLDAIKERLGSVEAQLKQATNRANTLIGGGNLT